MEDSPAASEARREQIRELCHDAKNHLFIVVSGLDMLEQDRADPEKFAEMLEMIRRDGAAPLRQAIEQLAELAGKRRSEGG